MRNKLVGSIKTHKNIIRKLNCITATLFIAVLTQQIVGRVVGIFIMLTRVERCENLFY